MRWATPHFISAVLCAVVSRAVHVNSRRPYTQIITLTIELTLAALTWGCQKVEGSDEVR